MTADNLNNYTLKDLTTLARKRGVAGWHGMRKEQLVRALLKLAQLKISGGSKAAAPAKSNGKKHAVAARLSKPVAERLSKPVAKPTPQRLHKPAAAPASAPTAASVSKPIPAKVSSNGSANGAPRPNGAAARANSASVRAAKLKRDEVIKRLEQAKLRKDRLKNLSSFRSPSAPNGFSRDRLVVMVRDSYWLHAYWELTRQGVERAQAAMGEQWHSARPALRLMEVSSSGTTNASEMVLRTIEVHGGVNNWYVDVADPPRSYRLDVGYQSPAGKFFLLARSNVVTTPKAGASDTIDENWSPVAENFDKIYAMSGGYAGNGSSGELQELFEERLRRPMGAPLTTRYVAGMNGFDKKHAFSFEVDAELIVFGVTEPDAHVTLQGDPVRVRPDGSFTVRFSMPNCRQVIPAVASSADGVEQRTIVLAVERNTKTMEPVVRDGNE